VAAGYSFGRVRDRDFGDSRSAGGPYLGVTFKVNKLFDGFGLQKPPLTILPQESMVISMPEDKSDTHQ
jgi:hypothetical protein